MDRRAFLKLSAAAAGAAAMTAYGTDLLRVAYASTSSQMAVAAATTSTTTTSTMTMPDPSAPMSAELQVPHLLRRAGFGGGPQEQATYQDMGFDEAVQYLLNYSSIDNSALDAITPDIRTSYAGTVPTGQNEEDNLASWWLNRMVQTPRPLEEKMTLFWHNHFATAISKVQNGYLMYQQNEFLRANALGNFHDIMNGITSDGAMLIWLDGILNRKNNPNENYAREVMEVFTTGRGPYTENDVANGALAFTGYLLNPSGEGVFVPQNHNDSIKTFLGETGNFGPTDIIDILVARPETATNLSTELFQFFGYPDPDPDTVSNLASIYVDSGYEIQPMVEAILTSPEFVSNQAYLANVKSPTEYVVDALRSLGAVAPENSLVSTTNNQGQLLFDPPNVFGWPSGLGWINTGSMMERFNFPLSVQTTDDNPASGFDPATYFPSGGSVSAGVNSIANALFPDGMPSNVLSVIDSATSNYTNPVLMTKNALRLTMGSPYYNLN